MGQGRLTAGGAAGIAGLMLATSSAQGAPVPGAASVPGPELEYGWETGSAGTVHDGDTLDVRIATSNSGYTGTQRVRTIGINAPEVQHTGQQAQCGSSQAKAALKALAPSGTPLQLRALKGTSFDSERGRIVRSIYALDEEGNWFDTARQLVSDGTVLWFPRDGDSPEIPEFAHNVEYRVLAEDARVAARGLWRPNRCGPSPAANLRLSVSWDQDDSVTGYETIFIINDAPAATALGGWTLRDSALNLYTLPRNASVPAKGSIEVRLTNGVNAPAKGVYYAGSGSWFSNLPADNSSFTGDAAYLMDSAGPYQTGNLRAWFPYPCNPDDCGDPLVGSLKVQTPVAADWNTGQDVPGVARQVNAAAAADGSGNIIVSWQAPTYTGDGGPLDYRVTATRVGGSALPTREVQGVAGRTSHSSTFTGLTAGEAYTFHVVAVNSRGASAASAESSPVTSRRAPAPPTGAHGTAGPNQIVAGWTGPTDDNGATVSGYLATASPQGGGEVRTCQTVGAETSCAISGLVNGSGYRITVRAQNSAGQSAASAASAPATPQAYVPGVAPATAPTSVTARGINGAAVVSWVPPASDGGLAITAYTASVVGDPTRSCVAAGAAGRAPATSCVVAGLANGASYAFTVRATANTAGLITDPLGGPASAPSPGAIPVADTRAHAATGTPGPNTAPWTPRETIRIRNDTGSPIDLTGYALWDKDPRPSSNGTRARSNDTPDYVFPRGTTIPPSTTLRIRSGAQTTVEPSGATLHYTGRPAKFTAGGDRIEVANLNKALVHCTAWGAVTCRGQRQVTNPTQPVGVTARTTPGSVTIQWGAPISRGGTAITGYTATAYDARFGGRVVGSCTTDGSGRACSFPGAIGVRYYAEVVARNTVGTSAPSAPRVLAAPRTVPSAPSRVSTSGVRGGVTVRWGASAPNGATVSSYTAYAYAAGTGGRPIGSCTASGVMRQCTIVGLPVGVPSFMAVVATNRAGNSAPSSPRVSGRPFGPPAAVTTYSGRRITVRWDATTGAGTPGLTGYTARVYTKATGGTYLGRCTASARATSCRTGKLKKRKKYYVELSLNSALGSSRMHPRIVTGPPRRATAPRVTRATPAGSRVVIAWSPPSFNGYSYLKGYGARLYSKPKRGSVKASCRSGPAITTCTTKPMRKGTYYAAARVKNSKGWSTWSKRLKVVVR